MWKGLNAHGVCVNLGLNAHSLCYCSLGVNMRKGMSTVGVGRSDFDLFFFDGAVIFFRLLR